MIISHKYKYIFLKTNRPAGTSVEIALSKFCGVEDIITPINPEDERLRESLGYRGSQNYYISFSKYNVWDWIKLVRRGKRKKYYNHIPAEKIRNYIGAEIWDNYYKFCFERNPWDRVVSLYYYHFKGKSHPPISEFIESSIPYVLKLKGFQLYTIRGKIVVDKVYFYEDLQAEIEEVGRRLSISDEIILPRAKISVQRKGRHYKEILNEEDRAMIARMFAEEIAHFGYKY